MIYWIAIRGRNRRTALIVVLAFSFVSYAAIVPPVHADSTAHHTIIEERPFLVDRDPTVVKTQNSTSIPKVQPPPHGEAHWPPDW
ncbi:hypothetical protein H2248_011780 [Termitomyces sp. 'cryptogamus']|nr:hypothetical protein H2248_011780 [Termitomyces sp. 'cryptogamus']